MENTPEAEKELPREETGTAEESSVSPEETAEEKKPGYQKRPLWQVWGARIVLVLFIALLIRYYVNIMRGGR